VPLREPTKFNQLGFGRLQSKAELAQSPTRTLHTKHTAPTLDGAGEANAGPRKGFGFRAKIIGQSCDPFPQRRAKSGHEQVQYRPDAEAGFTSITGNGA
jgi:hypothetical protein